MRKLVLFVLMSALCVPQIMGQKLGIEALLDTNTGYPKLMAKFGNELEQKRADYFFVIDVSGSMNRYQDIVVSALNEFFSSLQDGDYVNVIHFGSEAEVVNGCYGTIDRKKIQSLSSNTNQIYFNERPADPILRERLWNYTDLDNAMHTLANEMHQLGLNDLKFVFIITDFEHEPPASRRGHEDWAGVRQQFEKEQAQSNVNVITLQLPGSPSHIKQVRECFPNTFNYQYKAVADGSDLASWFTRLKNNIMLERFKAIILEKVQDANLNIVPSVDINGNMDLSVSWQPNELFDSICITSVSVTDANFSVKGFNNMTIGDTNTTIKGLNIAYNDTSVYPLFHKFNGDIVIAAEYDAPYMDELCRLLGNEMSSIEATANCTKNVFCYYLSLGWCIVILLLIVCYLSLVLSASRRNRRMSISGKFSVERDGQPFGTPVQLNKQKVVSIGSGRTNVSVTKCNWQVSLFVKTWNPFAHPFKKPVIKVKLVQGKRYIVNGREHSMADQIKIARYTNIVVDGDRIIWNI